MQQDWGKWIRDNADKYLLAILILIMVGVTLHLLHHGTPDGTQLNFMNGLTNTFVGAFITLVTGAIARSASARTEVSGGKSDQPNTVTDLEVKQ